MIEPHARHFGRFSLYFGTRESDVVDRQGRRIVQSDMNLYDLLPVTDSVLKVLWKREVGSPSLRRPIQLAGIHLVTPGPHTRWVWLCYSTLA